jgi:hypothetical protein
LQSRDVPHAPLGGTRQTPFVLQTSEAWQGLLGPQGASSPPWHAPATHAPMKQSESTAQAVPGRALQRSLPVQSHV